MNFLHISTGDTLGAFSGAYRLHRNLINDGHQSFMLVGHKTSSDDTVIAPPRWLQLIRKFLEKASSVLAKACFGYERQLAHIFKLNMGIVPVRTLTKSLPGYQPDLVIVYYVADFISERQIADIQQRFKAPVVFYLMDMGMLTGACHYAWECTGYQRQCGNCPKTGSPLLKRMIARKWKSRKKHYTAINPTIVTGSAQQNGQSRASGLAGTLRTETILMGVSPVTYSPELRPGARRAFGIDGDDIVFYFGAQSVADRRKGFSHLLDAMKHLSAMLTSAEIASICLFTVGSADPGGVDLPFRKVHRAFISDQDLFRQTYAAADIFICPSVEDSGPMMVNESMMSGTPVAAFDIGVAIDLVVPDQTGYRLPVGDALALAEALARFVRLPAQQRSAMGAACRERALMLCSSQVQTGRFEELARTLAPAGRRACA